MCLSLVDVELGHCIELPSTTRAWKLGVSMERSPVVGSMGGSAKFFSTTLTGAGMERFVVVDKLFVLPQRVHVCQLFVATLPGAPLLDGILGPLGCLLPLQPSALGDRGRPNLVLEKAELDRFNLRDLNPVHHLSIPVGVEDNVDFHPGSPNSRGALDLGLDGQERP